MTYPNPSLIFFYCCSFCPWLPIHTWWVNNREEIPRGFFFLSILNNFWLFGKTYCYESLWHGHILTDKLIWKCRLYRHLILGFIVWLLELTHFVEAGWYYFVIFCNKTFIYALLIINPNLGDYCLCKSIYKQGFLFFFILQMM